MDCKQDTGCRTLDETDSDPVGDTGAEKIVGDDDDSCEEDVAGDVGSDDDDSSDMVDSEMEDGNPVKITGFVFLLAIIFYMGHWGDGGDRNVLFVW